MVQRRCIGCWQLNDKKDMIKITAKYPTSEIAVNPNSLIFGRSVYLCYNESCIESSFRKNKISKHLKVPVQKELKGQLLNELRNS